MRSRSYVRFQYFGGRLSSRKSLVIRERQQRDIARLLDGRRHATLMPCANARETPRHDLPALRHELLQQAHVFVAHAVNFLDAKLADFLAAEKLASARSTRTARRTRRTRPAFPPALVAAGVTTTARMPAARVSCTPLPCRRSSCWFWHVAPSRNS